MYVSTGESADNKAPPPLRRSGLQLTKGCFLMSGVEEALRYSEPPAALGRGGSNKGCSSTLSEFTAYSG